MSGAPRLLVTTGYFLDLATRSDKDGSTRNATPARDCAPTHVLPAQAVSSMRDRTGQVCWGRNDKNQRRKRSPMACFITSPPTSEIAFVSGISLGQTSTQ